MGMRLVVMGPSHSGKSTTVAALLRLMADRLGIQWGTYELRFITLDLTDNTAGHLARGEPRRREVDWTSERVEARAREFENTEATLVLADAPGKIDEHTRRLLRPADAVLLIAPSEDALRPWEELARELSLPVLGRIVSVTLGSGTKSHWDPATRRGILRGLDPSVVAVPNPLALPADTQAALIELARTIWEDVAG